MIVRLVMVDEPFSQIAQQSSHPCSTLFSGAREPFRPDDDRLHRNGKNVPTGPKVGPHFNVNGWRSAQTESQSGLRCCSGSQGGSHRWVQCDVCGNAQPAVCWVRHDVFCSVSIVPCGLCGNWIQFNLCGIFLGNECPSNQQASQCAFVQGSKQKAESVPYGGGGGGGTVNFYRSPQVSCGEMGQVR